jgi:hypothetical protein
MYHYGTSTDHIDLMDQVRELLTSDQVATVAVNSGGTGYAVDDILTVAGGTASHAAQIRVTAVSSGVITSVRIEKSGAYTADPTLTANAVTGGTGSSATMDLTMSTATWSTLAWSREAVSATVTDGGTGYTVNDQLTLVGGTLHVNGVTGSSDVAAVFNVDSVSGGVITAVSLVTAGHYQVAPAGAVTVTGGTGSGATLTVTYQGVTDDDQVLALQGTASGSTNAPLMGLHAYSSTDRLSTNPTYNWAVFSFTNWDPNSILAAQANPTDAYTSTAGSLSLSTSSVAPQMILKDADAYDMDYWLQWTGRHMQLVCKVSSASTQRYPSMFAGLLSPFSPGTEEPYPMYVSGSTDISKSRWDDTIQLQSGIGEPIGTKNASVWTGSAWRPVYNATANGTTVTYVTNYQSGVWPGLDIDLDNSAKSDEYTNAGFSRQDLVYQTASWKLMRTPDTGGDIFPIWRRYVMTADIGDRRVYGELPGHFWMHTANEAISSEDTLTQGGTTYILFHSGDRTERYSFFALETE